MPLLTEQFTIAPLEGITDLPCSFVVADLLFVNDTDCAGTENGSIKAYILVVVVKCQVSVILEGLLALL